MLVLLYLCIETLFSVLGSKKKFKINPCCLLLKKKKKKKNNKTDPAMKWQ